MSVHDRAENIRYLSLSDRIGPAHNVPAYYFQIHFNITLPFQAVSCHVPHKTLCLFLF